jgi:hypothetical protein
MVDVELFDTSAAEARALHRTPRGLERCQRSDRYAAPQGCIYAAFTHRAGFAMCAVGPIAALAGRAALA